MRPLPLAVVLSLLAFHPVVVAADEVVAIATTGMTFGVPGKAPSTSACRAACVHVDRQGQWRMPALPSQPRQAD